MREHQIERVYIGSRFGKVYEPDSWWPTLPGTYRCPQVFKIAVQEWRLGKRADNPRSVQQREDWERYSGPYGETEYAERADIAQARFAQRMRDEQARIRESAPSVELNSPFRNAIGGGSFPRQFILPILHRRRRVTLIPDPNAPPPYNPDELLQS